jgi:hypothetical protein
MASKLEGTCREMVVEEQRCYPGICLERQMITIKYIGQENSDAIKIRNEYLQSKSLDRHQSLRRDKFNY